MTRRVLFAGIGGALGTAFDVAVLIVLVDAGVSIPAAAFLGAASGAGACFVANKLWAFRDRTPVSLQQVGAFGLVAVGTALLMAFAMWLLATRLAVPYLVAKAVCAALVFAAWSYPAQRRFVFTLRPSARQEVRMSHAQLAHAPIATAPHGADVDLSVVVPAYNEELRLGLTLERLHAYLSAGDASWEILVVDDGSTDGTAALVARLARARPGVRLIRSTPNRGKGSAVRIGMLAARGRVRVMCDADGSTPPEQLPALLAPIVAGDAEVAIGSRYVDGARVGERQPLYRIAWSRLCNAVVQRALVPGVRDTQCGFKAFTADAAHDLFARARIDGWAFDLEILALARRRCYGIVEVAVAWSDDPRSRVSPWRDMWKVAREAVTIRRNLRRGVYGHLMPA